jgi:hypothetical protein
VPIAEVKSTLNANKSFKLLKRKLESLESNNLRSKKSKLSLDDLVDGEGLPFLTCVLNELSSGDLIRVANMAFDQEDFFTEESQFISENNEIQVALFFVILEKILQNLKVEDQSTEFIKKLLELRTSSLGLKGT